MSISPIVVVAALFFLAQGRALAEEPLHIELGGGQTLEVVRIGPGSFQQGSLDSEVGRGADETQRKVTLVRPFYLGKFPVTRGQFARFATESGYRTEAEIGTSGGFGWDGAALKQRKDFTWKNPGFLQTDAHPVTIVTYKDAEAFLRWLSRKSGRAFSLPSEAQWEYAARAGGSPMIDGWNKENSANSTHAVGEKPLNAWGLGDMPGNVWEWCEDWYAPYDPAAAIDPIQHDASLSDKPRRVLRGGSWLREPKFCRPAARYRNDALSRNADNGFRVMTFDLEAKAASPPPAAVVVPPSLDLEKAESSGRTVVEPRAPISEVRPGVVRFGFAWLLALPVISFFLFVAAAIIRAIAKSIGATSSGSGRPSLAPTSTLSSAQPLSVRLGEDGFWIVGAGVSAGTPVACRYSVNGNPQSQSVRFEPGPQGHFVFTGSRPENVSVSAGLGGAPGTTTSRRFGNAIGMASELGDAPPFHGHPPAY